MSQKNYSKNQYKWLTFINIPIQMGTIIFLFSYFGNWLDAAHPSSVVYYHKLLIVLGVLLAMYNVIRQVNAMGASK